MKDQSLTGKLLFGTLVGAGLGLAVSWVMANRVDSEPESALQVPKKSVSVNEIVGLGFAMLKVARQAAELARKA
jgi:hypothetical protein